METDSVLPRGASTPGLRGPPMSASLAAVTTDTCHCTQILKQNKTIYTYVSIYIHILRYFRYPQFNSQKLEPELLILNFACALACLMKSRWPQLESDVGCKLDNRTDPVTPKRIRDCSGSGLGLSWFPPFLFLWFHFSGGGQTPFGVSWVFQNFFCTQSWALPYCLLSPSSEDFHARVFHVDSQVESFSCVQSMLRLVSF